ncbi:baseplate J/gp47 family protein [Terrisporobacter hibernicus]|uniref:Baseplate J/gp47 family protein n=1 Tax=Terrisporobacter hibernicus TaxID=2813371 RepID=A0AAX2ZEC2_9FIRM|nr:baseplate J/gp47 family protein [Terrisporobacter hibernicus]UEL47361.1 baseplate J/gp47 family protein [Terrisporobacter hibernicus]
MYSAQTYDVIKERILDNNTSDVDKSEGSFTHDMIAPIATEFARTYIEFENMLKVMFVEDAYDEYLDKKAGELGMKRKLGNKAQGTVRVYAPDNTLIPRNATIVTDEGLVFLVYRQVYIKSEYVDVLVEAENVGEDYNIQANMSWNTTISDTENNTIEVESIVNDNNFTGGVEIESDDDFRERIFQQAQNPSTSGNSQDYINWCKEIDSIENVTVRPLWNGANTVKLIVSDKDKQPVSSVILKKCDEYIQDIRPILADVTVCNPEIFEVNISINIYTKYSIESIKEEIQELTVEFLKNCSDKIQLNRLGSEYLGIEGILDYSNFTINGSSNVVVSIPVDHVAVLKNLNITVSQEYGG